MSENIIDLATVPTVTSPSGLSLIGLNGSGQIKKTDGVLMDKGIVSDLNEAFLRGIYHPNMGDCANSPNGYLTNNSDVVVCFSISSAYSIQFLISLNDMRVYRRSKVADRISPWSVINFTPIS